MLYIHFAFFFFLDLFPPSARRFTLHFVSFLVIFRFALLFICSFPSPPVRCSNYLFFFLIPVKTQKLLFHQVSSSIFLCLGSHHYYVMFYSALFSAAAFVFKSINPLLNITCNDYGTHLLFTPLAPGRYRMHDTFILCQAHARCI